MIQLLDGATGTQYIAAGLPVGDCPEMLNLTHPDAVCAINRGYVEAGSAVIYANTFGANRIKAVHAQASVTEMITAGIAIAKRATAGTDCKVALDIGPIGKLLEPYGDLPFAQAVDVFAEMITAGTQAGADMIVIETMADLYEVKAALFAARENSPLPVYVTMTFESNLRTYTGTSVEAFAAFATAWGVAGLGVNCSLGPVELYPVVKRLAVYTDLPLIVKANAGLPNADGSYNFPPDLFAQEMIKYVDLGANWLGGCCGTSPAHIRALAQAVATLPEPPARKPNPHTVLCTSSQAVIVDGVIPIGESLNPTNKPDLLEALLEGDMDVIQDYALDQQDSGALLLDINISAPGVDEVATMPQVVRAVQEVCNLPLVLDSLNPQALEAGLRVINGRCLINSVKATEESLSTILPLAKKYGAAVIGLTMDENGLPETVEQRIAIAQRLLDACLAHGLHKRDLIIDCLVLGDAYMPHQTAKTLEAVAHIKTCMGLHCTLGISNISHGFPNREARNADFLQQAIDAGVDIPIVNVLQAPTQEILENYA